MRRIRINRMNCLLFEFDDFILWLFRKPDMSRLRLAAGCAVLRLAQEPCYHEIITLEQYQLCALVINVSLEHSFITSHL